MSFLDRWSPWRLRNAVRVALRRGDELLESRDNVKGHRDKLRAALECAEGDELHLQKVRKERDAAQAEVAALRQKLDDVLTAANYRDPSETSTATSDPDSPPMQWSDAQVQMMLDEERKRSNYVAEDAYPGEQP